MDNDRKIKGNKGRNNLGKKRARYSNAVADATVERLFSKRFQLIIDGRWKLPSVQTWFTEGAWKVERLQELKNELNETKSKLNDYNLTEWSRHTRLRNKAGQVNRILRRDIKPELLTQAWCKFYENVCSFALIGKKSLADEKLNSVHLCEAPGAFVASLNHWLNLNAPKVQWNWLATTLNPHYEGNSMSTMINDDRLICYTTDNWFFGDDNTGNIMDLKNLDATVRRAGKNVGLVTADGSIDCTDSPGEQELIVSQLHYCQVVAALNLLEKEGNFLFKVFTIFEHRTISIIYLLCCCFEKVFVNKPVTSKEGNSEVYVVCLKFKGEDIIASYKNVLRDNYEKSSDMAMFRKSDIPEDFIDQIVDCGKFFKAHQCETIINNMRTFGGYSIDGCDETDDIKSLQRTVAERFIEEYGLRPLPSEHLEIVGKSKLAEHDSTMVEFRAPLDSYNVRQNRKNFSPIERLNGIIDKLAFIELPDTKNTFQLKCVPDKLWISTGKPYTKISSSKFCTAVVLKMYSNALDIIDEMKFSEPIPSSETVQHFRRQNSNDAGTIVNFGYTSMTNDRNSVIKICETLKNIENNENLTLLGYSLLTQLNVGILHVLSRNFETIELLPNEKLGCIIKLKNYIKIEKYDETLMKKIYEASMDAEKNDRALLSVLPLSTLCDSPLYRHIVNVNHWVISHCVREAFATLSQKKCYD